MAEIPSTVLDCVDEDKKKNAIAAYSRGTLEEQNVALHQCAIANTSEAQKVKREERKKIFAEHVAYYKRH